MPRIEQFAQLQLIYIDEAHAIDVWPIGNAAGVLNKKHKSMEDRRRCARTFWKDRVMPHIFEDMQKKNPKQTPPTWLSTLLLDNWNNHYKEAFASWPVRVHVVENATGKIKFVSMTRDGLIDVTGVYRTFGKRMREEIKRQR